MYQMPLNCILKKVKMVKSYGMFILPQKSALKKSRFSAFLKTDYFAELLCQVATLAPWPSLFISYPPNPFCRHLGLRPRTHPSKRISRLEESVIFRAANPHHPIRPMCNLPLGEESLVARNPGVQCPSSGMPCCSWAQIFLDLLIPIFLSSQLHGKPVL